MDIGHVPASKDAIKAITELKTETQVEKVSIAEKAFANLTVKAVDPKTHSPTASGTLPLTLTNAEKTKLTTAKLPSSVNNPATPWGQPVEAKNRNEALFQLFGLNKTKRSLGQGAFGKVCLFTDHSDTPYAVKIPWSEYQNMPFDGEALATGFKHPNIVETYALLLQHSKDDHFVIINQSEQIPESEKKSYKLKGVVMEYLEGNNLEGDPDFNGCAQTAIQYGLDAARSLAYLQSLGVVYRDLKLENLMKTPHGLKLVDFGFCQALETNETSTEQRGTSMYMSPEMINEKPHDTRHDNWCLGVLLMEIVSKGRIFPCFWSRDRQPPLLTSDANIMTATKAFAEASDEEKEIYLASNSIIPPKLSALKTIIVRLLDKNPDTRMTAAQAADELEKLYSQLK